MSGHQPASLHDNETASRLHARDSAAGASASPVHPLIRIQSAIGNSAVARYLAQRQEVPEEEELQMLRDRDVAQRQEVPEEEELQMLRDPLAQRQPEEEEEEVQALHTGAEAGPTVGLEGGPLNDDISRQIESARGGGSALSDAPRSTMENAFGADFSGVRVHQDGASDSLARGMTARAFTTGSDIFLRNDVSPGDTKVLAHELTHVVQQSSGRVRSEGPGMTVGAAGDAHEQEADEVATAVTSGATTALDDEGAAG